MYLVIFLHQAVQSKLLAIIEVEVLALVLSFTRANLLCNFSPVCPMLTYGTLGSLRLFLGPTQLLRTAMITILTLCTSRVLEMRCQPPRNTIETRRAAFADLCRYFCTQKHICIAVNNTGNSEGSKDNHIYKW